MNFNNFDFGVRQAAQNAKSTRIDTVFVAGFVSFVIFVFSYDGNPCPSASAYHAIGSPLQ